MAFVGGAVRFLKVYVNLAYTFMLTVHTVSLIQGCGMYSVNFKVYSAHAGPPAHEPLNNVVH